MFTVPRWRKKIANFGRPVTVTGKKSDKYLKMADTGFLVLPKLLQYHYTVEFSFEANFARTKYFCH